MPRYRILFLTPRFPYPLIGGDRIKSFNLLRHLARQHEVHLVSFNHGGAPSREQLDAVAALGVTVHPVPLQPLMAGFRAHRTLYTDLPLEVAFYTQPAFRATVEQLLARQTFDLGIAFFMRTAEYLRNLPMRKILIAEDCRALYQSRSIESSRRWLQRAVRWWEVRKLRSYEPRIADHFDATTFVTHTDIEALRRHNAGANLQLLTNGVDLDEYIFRDEQDARADLLFFGNMRLWANHLMVERIARRILPLLRRSNPDVRFRVVGARPARDIRALASDSILIHADVPDIKSFVYESAVLLHPHMGASGIQNKVLQAMSLGCAVVTTPTGIQGIAARHDTHALIGETDAELAEHCARLLNDPALRSRLACNARELIERDHSWELIFRQLDRIIEQVMPAPSNRNGAHARPASERIVREIS